MGGAVSKAVETVTKPLDAVGQGINKPLWILVLQIYQHLI